MSTRAIPTVLLISLSLTQLPAASSQQPSASTAPAMVIVPAGTIVPLTLVNPIKSKSTKPGDSIRAVVAFPITVDGQVAVPAGTYVEGTLAPPLPKVKHQPDPDVQLHLNRFLFANGYSAPIDATQARALAPAVHAPVNDLSENDHSGLKQLQAPSQIGNSFVSGQAAPTQTLPPLHSDGLSPAVLVGAGLGAIGVVAAVTLLARHKGNNSDLIVHDAGWQFQMKLEAPVSLDAGQIALAASGR